MSDLDLERYTGPLLQMLTSGALHAYPADSASSAWLRAIDDDTLRSLTGQPDGDEMARRVLLVIRLRECDIGRSIVFREDDVMEWGCNLSAAILMESLRRAGLVRAQNEGESILSGNFGWAAIDG